MITFPEAQIAILAHAKSFGTETVAIENTLHRVLAEDTCADRDYPPFNRATMDGIAIRHQDFDSGTREFELIEIIYAGQESSAALLPGTCYKIMTGAAIPVTADTVIRREDIDQHGTKITVRINECRKGQNIAPRAQDLRAGELAVKRGTVCTPVVISILAALGKNSILVERFPVVSVVTTGNEVKPLGTIVSAVEIRNSNSYLLRSLLLQNGITAASVEHVPDDRTLLDRQLKKGLESDILIINGGVSAGDADYVPEILEGLGVKKLFHKVAMRPGKPFWCGRMPSGGMVFALPGNPFSCMTTFKLFIEFYLNASMGKQLPAQHKLPISENRAQRVGLDEFFPVKIAGEPPVLEALPINGSGDIRLGLEADALALHPAQQHILSLNEPVTYFKL